MAVAALVLGILGVILFSWLGPAVGVAWATTLTIQAFSQASTTGVAGEVVTWPLWLTGLVIGVGLPAVAVVLGAIGMAKTETKGVAIGGIVTGAVGMIGGFILIFVFQAFALVGQAAVDGMADPDQFSQQMQQLQQQLDDPMMQQQIQQQLQRAADQANQSMDSAGKPEPMELEQGDDQQNAEEPQEAPSKEPKTPDPENVPPK